MSVIILPFCLRPRTPPHPILKQQSYNHEQSLPPNVPGHFGMALKSIRKHDWHFGGLPALPPELVRHFDLETVAIGAHFLELDGFEGPAAEAFVATGWIAE